MGPDSDTSLLCGLYCKRVAVEYTASDQLLVGDDDLEADRVGDRVGIEARRYLDGDPERTFGIGARIELGTCSTRDRINAASTVRHHA